MHRRDFLKSSFRGSAGLLFASSGVIRNMKNIDSSASLFKSEHPDDIRITRIVGFNLTSHRIKQVGNNAVGGVHGREAVDRMVRLMTNTGLEGIGRCYADEQILVSLLGKNPFTYYQPGEKRMQCSLGVHTMPLWDLVGKSLHKPVYDLLGHKGYDKVPAYDGSIYFSDLMQEFSGNYADRFRQEIDMGLNRGFRAFKVKVGRGYKWMDRQEGYHRDIEVLKIIRTCVGQDIQIGIDANNGHTLSSTKSLLQELPDYNLSFVEEMFPEEINECLELKEFMHKLGWKTLLADGETQSTPIGLKPFIDARAIDVLQGDLNTFGIEGILTEAAWAEPQGLKVAPHNWGSLLGFYGQLHLGKALPHFYMAECDPLESEVLVADGYSIKDGMATVPETPGFGLKLDEQKFASSPDIKILFDLS